MTPSLVLYKFSILNAHTNDTNGSYFITFYSGPVHSVKNLRKVRTECTELGERAQHRYILMMD
jgi:hypothetical protein